MSKFSENISSGKDYFEYALMTYVIHEVDGEIKVTLLNEMAQLSI